ncbi:hypothetical protein CSUB01_10322 [Colletotrichum sublineola]|uniref:Uncharacterized protein n=1 Tax=Colletotrichum sublineola TaxID=1173701 RepID=A0A066X855_COLSU|nr:hypothetical protein CSUB01_10322 [Colletotrichum sublineola]
MRDPSQYESASCVGAGTDQEVQGRQLQRARVTHADCVKEDGKGDPTGEQSCVTTRRYVPTANGVKEGREGRRTWVKVQMAAGLPFLR